MQLNRRRSQTVNVEQFAVRVPVPREVRNDKYYPNYDVSHVFYNVYNDVEEAIKRIMSTFCPNIKPVSLNGTIEFTL